MFILSSVSLFIQRFDRQGYHLQKYTILKKHKFKDINTTF